MGKISVIVNVVEAELVVLPQALDSVQELVDEVVLIDMTGGEELKKIASRFGAKVFKHDFVPWVEPVRNFGINQAGGDWILILDPDEELSPGLKKKLKSIVQKPSADYYRLPRKNLVFGKWVKHSRWWPDYNIRFFKKGSVSWSEVIHAVPMTTGKGEDLEDKEDLAIIHHHYTSIEQFVERMNRYTSQQAQLKVKEGYEFNWPDLIKKPSGEFLSRYFQGQGYKDGLHGLALAGLQAFSELVVFLKIWQTEKFKEERLNPKEVIGEMKKVESDFHYWQADLLLKQGGGIIQRIKRKFKV